jgi:hypothetical protein
MQKFAEGAALLAATAWAGALWGVGYLAVPVLFRAQPDRMLAGLLAGDMFTLIAYLGMGCGAYLLAYLLATQGWEALRQTPFRIVLAMLLLALVMQFGIQPVMAGLKAQAQPLDVMHSEFAGQFKMLHGVSAILYLLQSLLGAVLVLKIRKP